MSAYFHKSFTLNCDNISKILTFVSDNPSASRHDIAIETGIGIGKNESDGKVRPTIQYAIYSGLLNPASAEKQNPILLTPTGQIIFENDKRLKSPVTHWAMHYYLCRPNNEALIWSFFIHTFLPQYSNFDSQTLEAALADEFPSLSQRITKENRRILIDCYTSGNSLAKTRILENYEKDKFIRGKPNYPNPYLAAYILAEIWEARHPEKMMIEPSVLLEKGSFATTMNLTEADLKTCLSEMSAIGAIDLMREAPPFQVVRHWTDKNILLRRAYEEN